MRTLDVVVFSIGEEVALEQHRQGEGGTLNGVGLLHSSHRVISLDAKHDNLTHRHPLEVYDVVRRHHAKGPLNAEAEGTFEMLGHLTTQ